MRILSVEEGAPPPSRRQYIGFQAEIFYHGKKTYDVLATVAFMRAGLLPCTLATVELEGEFMDRMLTTRKDAVSKKYEGWYVSSSHLTSITKSRLEVPGMMAATLNRLVIVDGNHRAVARYMQGKRTMKFYLLNEREIPNANHQW